MTLAIGGSAGHSESWWADINEGVPRTGRRWEVKIYPSEPAIIEKTGAKK